MVKIQNFLKRCLIAQKKRPDALNATQKNPALSKVRILKNQELLLKNYFDQKGKNWLLLKALEDTAHYVGILLAPAGGIGQGLFFALRAKKEAFYAVLPIFRPF